VQIVNPGALGENGYIVTGVKRLPYPGQQDRIIIGKDDIDGRSSRTRVKSPGIIAA
jgi:hypothetical protein